jgi:hypothetical protein
MEIHKAEPLLPDPSPFVVEIAIAKLKRYKSPGSDQSPPELIQAGREILRSESHKKKELRGFSPQANYTDRATAACRRS